ncbi:elongator complex protein 5 [Spea bombifrons]|uniref:elongator complex protein 5 n=1 Tax=Spea bombifrons TaxID=233779 RepID=UPI00234AB384|nr:elongator complex protein 5 [Spea bombifrons]
MLHDLRSSGFSGVLLITDSAAHSGRELLYSFVLAALQRSERVHVFGFEVSREDFVAGFPEEPASRLVFHDGFSDPLRWGGNPRSLTKEDFTAGRIVERVGGSACAVTVVLDSLSWLLSHCPLTSVCRTLRTLSRSRDEAGSRDIRVLAFMHADLHPAGVSDAVRLLADTAVHVTERGERHRVTVTHRRRSGKIVIAEEELRIRDAFTLEILTQQESEQSRRKEVDPTEKLTFNLRLSDAEREEKASAALPYVFSASKKSSLLRSSTSSAKIFYDPDPEDDVDDEDPDDDLDV